MTTRMRPSNRCSMKAWRPPDVLSPSASGRRALRHEQRQQHEEADGEDDREEHRERERACRRRSTPSPAAASEPERISQRVPMTSVS